MKAEEKEKGNFVMKMRSEFYKETRADYSEVVDNLNTYLFQK